MHVTFVYSDPFPTYVNWPGHFYVGIGLLSAVLKRDGHTTSLIHVTQKLSREEFLQRIEILKPDLIAFSSTTLTFKYVTEMAKWLLESGSAVPVISGGVHSTLFPSEVVLTPGIDMVCVGEGEVSLAELCRTIEKGGDYKSIPGIWVKDNGNVIDNGVCPIAQDLDTLPFTDRTIFDYPNLIREREGTASLMASRGCPYHCTYCSNRALKDKLFKGKQQNYVRFRSVDSTLEEIRQILQQYQFITSLWFDDDLFFLHKEWAEEFAEKYSAQIKLPFTCNMRPNHMTADIVALLKKAGCVEIRMGLESGNSRIRNDVLKRNLSDKQIIDAFNFCHESGIKTHSYNIIGIPYETTANVLETIKLNVRVKSDQSQVTIFYPMPKTELYDLCKEKGFTVDDRDGSDFFTAMLNTGTISKQRIYFLYRDFHLLTKIYRFADQLGQPAVKVLDTLLQSHLLDLIGWSLFLPRKIKSFLFPRKAFEKRQTPAKAEQC